MIDSFDSLRSKQQSSLILGRMVPIVPSLSYPSVVSTNRKQLYWSFDQAIGLLLPIALGLVLTQENSFLGRKGL